MTGMAGKISAFSMCRKGERVFQVHSCHSQGAGGWEMLEMQWVHPLQLPKHAPQGSPRMGKLALTNCALSVFPSRMNARDRKRWLSV